MDENGSGTSPMEDLDIIRIKASSSLKMELVHNVVTCARDIQIRICMKLYLHFPISIDGMVLS
jgi:hypothetical protein